MDDLRSSWGGYRHCRFLQTSILTYRDLPPGFSRGHLFAERSLLNLDIERFSTNKTGWTCLVDRYVNLLLDIERFHFVDVQDIVKNSVGTSFSPN